MSRRMGIIPKLVSQMWEQMERPHRLFDQRFGMAMQPQSLFGPSLFDGFYNRRSPYYRPWAEFMREVQDMEKEWEKGFSVIKDDKDKFHVALDVQQFKPEEINVKVIDNFIVVEGKHEEKQDDHGIISRHFVRKYMVPEQCDPDKAESMLSPDGILTITAPRKPEAIEHKRERVLKIEKLSKPALENQKQDDKQEQIENQKVAQSQ
ncbi:alpha-crystallin A chain-like [Phymastichus coffea]|uniref:alpha-crystallin A chain-like n=1 Tax=Phymastichus coffea TaxID=108790 RepID=UPI00273B2FD9|nr:alpha-crystallin A chain-like [Phymastichus coffea]